MIILISWTAVFLWMILIFNLSSQVVTQSDRLSKGIANINIGTIEKVAPGSHFDITQFDHVVRKNAHFFVYLVLSVLVMDAMRRSGLKGVRMVIVALGICILYGMSDEIHQLFVPGRSSQISDVLIDSAGAIVGRGLYGVVGKIRRVMTNR